MMMKHMLYMFQWCQR